MITDIELYNWKAHENTSLSFQKGVNVLVGIMGAGKSSVMDAISFGLFGTFPALKQRRIKTENLIKSRPKKEERAKVRLSFVSGEDVYTVTREIFDSGGTTASLEKNGMYLQSQPIRVNEEISSILKIDYDTFSRAVYSEQNGLDYFLNITKSERKKQIDNMLGLDQFARAEENCTSLINSVRSLIADEEDVLNRTDRGRLEKELLDKTNEKNAVMASQKSIEKEMADIKDRIYSLDSTVKEHRKMLERRETLSNKLIAEKSHMQIIESEISRIKKAGGETSVGDAEKAVHVSEAGLKKMKEEDLVLSKEVIAFQKKIAGISAAAEEYAKKSAEKHSLMKKLSGLDENAINARIEENTKILEALISERESASGKLLELKEGIAALQKHIAECPVCERTIDDELRKSLLTKRALEVSRLEEAFKKASVQEEPVRKEIKRLESDRASLKLTVERLKDFDGIEEKAALLKSEGDAVSKEIAAIEEKRHSISRDMEKVQIELDRRRAILEDAKRMARHAVELERCIKDIAELENMIGEIKINPKEADALAAELAENAGKLSGLESTVSSNKKHIATLEFAVDSLSKQLSELNMMEKRISGRRMLLSDLGLFKTALSETSSELRSRLIHSINGLMGSVWNEIYPYNDYSKLSIAASADDYSLEVEVNGETGKEMVSVDSVASGGERSTACLALRVALSMTVVPNLRWLILDEPTHNLDSYGISSLIEVLGDELPKVVDQVFIITHDENMKQIASAKVYQFERDKASGGSVTVSQA
jgi:exonuclease SbcC